MPAFVFASLQDEKISSINCFALHSFAIGADSDRRSHANNFPSSTLEPELFLALCNEETSRQSPLDM
jgi:hypothetical protein